MAIEVQHQPVGAIHALATQAGQAQAVQREQERRERIQLQGMQEQLRMRELAFQEQAQSRARAEEMQYQMLMIQAKRQIDMQIEQSQYARQKEKLAQAMNMINESSHSEKEKEEFRMQAMAKYADVGTGLTPASFADSGMSKMVKQGAYKAQLLTQWQNDVSEGRMSVQDAERAAVGMGMSGAKFQSPAEIKDLPYKVIRDQLDDITSDINKLGIKEDGDGDYYQILGGSQYPIEESHPMVSQYKALMREAEKANRELMKLQGMDSMEGEGGEVMSKEEFVTQKIQGNPSLTQAAQLYGVDKVYAEYKKLTEK